MRPHPTPIRRQAALGSQGLAYFFIHGPGILHAQPNFLPWGWRGMGVASKMCFFRCFPFGAVGRPCPSGGFVYDVLLADAGVKQKSGMLQVEVRRCMYL